MGKRGKWPKRLKGKIRPQGLILDRLLHHSTAINIKGESYRLKEKKKAGLVGTTPKTKEAKEKK